MFELEEGRREWGRGGQSQLNSTLILFSQVSFNSEASCPSSAPEAKGASCS